MSRCQACGRHLLLLLVLLNTVRGLKSTEREDPRQLVPEWNGRSVKDLHREYGNIFKYGNRNAASHLWSAFLLKRAAQFDEETFDTLFSGFCAVSGSPVRPNDYNRYKLTLPQVGGGFATGYLHYCCWPCVCDTQDFIRVDTKTYVLKDGKERVGRFAVIGNPCNSTRALDEPFVQPFDGRTTTLRREAPEVRCSASGDLLGAVMSDRGHVIISMFFELPPGEVDPASVVPSGPPQPGRISFVEGVSVQDEYEWGPTCVQRAEGGYRSGMGEIFRRVAAIAPIPIG
eukprot:g1808.t1